MNDQDALIEENVNPDEVPTQDWGDPDGDGLLAAMSREFDGVESKPEKQEKKESKQEDNDDEDEDFFNFSEMDKEKKEESDDSGDDSSFDSDLSSEEKKEDEKSDESFDENSYDKQTSEILKALEEKGHPGDVYKKLRAELKEFKQRESKAEIPAEAKEKLQKLTVLESENENLKKEIDTLSNISAKVKMEQSAVYRDEVLAPAKQIMTTADEISKVYDADVSIIRNIIKTMDRKAQNEMIKDQLGDISEYDRMEVYRLAAEFRNVSTKSQKLLNEAKAKLDQIEADKIKESQRLLDEQRKAVRVLQDQIFDNYKEKIPGFIDENGDETEAFSKFYAKATAIDFSKARGKDQAFAAFAGSVFPHLLQEIGKLRSKVAEYEGTQEKKTRRSPSPSSGISTNQTSKPEKSFIEDFITQKF